MKRLFPWIVLVVAIVWMASECRPPKPAGSDFDLVTFSKIPVLVGGRLKPLDTVARNSLVIIHGKQTLRIDDKTLEARRWLADVLFNPDVADKYPVFVINNPDALGMFGWQQGERKYFSYTELSPFLDKIDEQGKKVEDVESAERTPFQTAIYNLRNSLVIYKQLKNSMESEDTKNFAAELETYEKAMPAGLLANHQREKGEPFDKAPLDTLADFAGRYEKLSEMSSILAVPPQEETAGQQAEWVSVGTSLLHAISTGEIHPVVKTYARISDAWRAGDASQFNQQVQELSSWMAQHEAKTVGRAAYEFFFNHIAPFYLAMQLYVLAFLLVCISWLCIGEPGDEANGSHATNGIGSMGGWSGSFGRAAFYVLVVALVIHTFGLASRIYLQGRPPVTNLYSSAIFIGWAVVILGLILERFYAIGIGAACAAIIGFITLVIAHHLAASGDTLEMLQAVLDTNIWLATHVVAITLGYSAMFLAGMMAILYVVLGVFTPLLKAPLNRKTASVSRTSRPDSVGKVLSRMVYGIVCFATLFSFVGTVLGGIWADQSWGRFWGWDPKENGALLIVLWCAVILHARWGGFIKDRGLMMMALFGNIITSFSWFGVNMLGVGLHSYGFMQKAMPWLIGFILTQLTLMAIANLPLDRWRSFRRA